MDSPLLYNPLDRLLVRLAKYFPLDLLALASITLYLFLCTIWGVFKNGVRIAFEVFELKKHATWPQSMIVAGVVLLCSVLATVTALTIMAPQYTAFGHQHFQHQQGTLRQCHLTASFGKNHSYVGHGIINMLPPHHDSTVLKPQNNNLATRSFIKLPHPHQSTTHQTNNNNNNNNNNRDDKNSNDKNDMNDETPHHNGQHQHHHGKHNGTHSIVGDEIDAAPRAPLHRPGSGNNGANKNDNKNNKNNNGNNNNSNPPSTDHSSSTGGRVLLPSSLTLVHGECRMSEISQMVTRMTVSLPFFAIASFFGSAAFIIVFIICAIYQSRKEKPSYYQVFLILSFIGILDLPADTCANRNNLIM
jgi:hypothetical protein